MKKPNRIIVQIEGGCIVGIYANNNQKITVDILDYDGEVNGLEEEDDYLDSDLSIPEDNEGEKEYLNEYLTIEADEIKRLERNIRSEDFQEIF